MTDHPPAIPPIRVRVTTEVGAYVHSLNGIVLAEYTATRVARVPLGLSPEQPARLGGEAMP